MAREVVEGDSSPEDATQVIGKEGFYQAHTAEATWLAGRLPGRGDSVDLRGELAGVPAAVTSGWMGL